MHSRVPPGLIYLSSSLPQVVLPPAFVYIVSFVVRSLYAGHIPLWATALAYALSWPLAIFAYIQVRDWKMGSEAQAMGAVLPPLVESKRIGGLDLVKTISQDLETHIFGMLTMIPSQIEFC